jgi:hypothetical protein
MSCFVLVPVPASRPAAEATTAAAVANQHVGVVVAVSFGDDVVAFGHRVLCVLVVTVVVVLSLVRFAFALRPRPSPASQFQHHWPLELRS